MPRFLTEDEAGYVPRDKIVLICTGSQGEPRAALARIARDDHPHIVLEEGDVVIFSSRIIPGNEKAISRLHNALLKLRVEVVTAEDHFVHVSGHPCRDELTAMYQMVRPRVAIPVHGEARHLIGHADLARQCQVQQAVVIENGDVIRLDGGGAAIVDEIPTGRIASDGKSLLPIRGAVLQQRRRAGVDGTAVASLVVDRAGSLAAPPQISLIGLAEATSEPAAALRRADRGRRGSAGVAAARRRGPTRDGPARVAARAQGTIRQATADRDSACPARRKAVIGRLNHVAIVVPDLAAAASLYREALGAHVSPPHPLPAHGVTVVFVELPNRRSNCWSRSATDSPVRGFLDKNPAGGMHHICYEVDDIIAARDRLRASGARILGDGEPRLGAHDKPVLFLHPKDFAGTLIELEQA